MKYLDIDTKDLKSKGGYNTAKEISSQPEMWLKTYERVLEEKDQISKFLANLVNKSNPCVILTGAGTSAFIGEVLAGVVQKQLRVSSKSIPTTDIITHAEDYFIRSKPTLLVSFARSGDSPESRPQHRAGASPRPASSDLSRAPARRPGSPRRPAGQRVPEPYHPRRQGPTSVRRYSKPNVHTGR